MPFFGLDAFGVSSSSIKLQPRGKSQSHGRWVAEHMGQEHHAPHHVESNRSTYGHVAFPPHDSGFNGRGTNKHGSIAGYVMNKMSKGPEMHSGKGISYQLMGSGEDNAMHLDSSPVKGRASTAHAAPAPVEHQQHHAPTRPNFHVLLDEDHIRMLLGKSDAELMTKIQAAAHAIELLFKNADSNSDGLVNYYELKALFRRINGNAAEEADKHICEEDRTSEPLIDYDKFIDVFLPTALSVAPEVLLQRITAVHGVSDRAKERASVAVARKGTSLFHANHDGAGVHPDFSKTHHGPPDHSASRAHHARRSSVHARKMQEDGHDGLGLGIGGHHNHHHSHDEHGHGQLHGGGFRGHIHHQSPARQGHRETHKNEHPVGLPDLHRQRQSVAIMGHGLVNDEHHLPGLGRQSTIISKHADSRQSLGHGLGDHDMQHSRSPRPPGEGAGRQSLAGQATRRKSMMAAKMRIGERLFQERGSTRASIVVDDGLMGGRKSQI